MNTQNTCPVCGIILKADHPKAICSGCALKDLVEVEAPLDQASIGLAGRKVADYELIREIARGGMGVVYQARQAIPPRMVALKLMLFGANAAPELVKRFQLEASAAAVLKHPNIVSIYEVGMRDGEYFIAMEYIEGANLSVLARTRTLTPRQTAQYLRAVAQAIEYAHERGILHRDLKPSNVIVGPDDQPRVTDFGLAKRLASHPSADNSFADRLWGGLLEDGESLTVSGQILGSPGFMPPEQARGARGKVDRRSDVYSLGAMLYHLLTGRPPFGGGSVSETLRQVESQEPIAPRLLNPGIPFDLETVCLKCLEKDPNRRYQTAGQLAEELDRFLRGQPLHARPVGRLDKLQRWGRRNPMASAFFGTVCFALLLALWLLYLVNQERNKQSVLVEQVKERDRANSVLLGRALEKIDSNLEGIWADREQRSIPLDSDEVSILAGFVKPPLTNKLAAVRWTFGLITDENPAQRVRQHSLLLSEIEARSAALLGREVRVDLRVYKFHEDFVADLLAGRVDFGRMGAVRYLRTRRAHPELIPLAVPMTHFKIGLLFTRTNSGIRSMADIVGHRVAFGETNSTITYRAQMRLAEQGIRGDRLSGYAFLDSTLDFADEVVEVGFSNALKRIGYLHSHAQVVEGVVEGRFDVGVAMRKAFLIHQSRGLMVIPGSEFQSSRNIHVMRPGLDARYVNALRHSMTNLQGYWLESLPDQSRGYIPIEPDLYREEEEWLEKIETYFPTIGSTPEK